MAKTFAVDNKNKYPYPSLFGSHRSMMVAEGCLVLDEKGNQVKGEDGKPQIGPPDGEHCVCEDEFGHYQTEIRRLDNGSSDPERYRESRLGKLFSGREKAKDK